MKARVNVLYFPGTNCQRETERAFQMAGADARVVFATDVQAGRDRLDNADILCIPGGFCYGDHVRAGLIAGSQLSIAVRDQLGAARQRPVLCICNGFQIGVRTGLFGHGVTLAVNEQGTFLNHPRQQHVVPANPGTPWLKGLEGQVLTFPCAHGEGNFMYRERDGWAPALYYPENKNPDGSMENIAGIATPDGLVFGLMNHPERALHDPVNLQIFRNGLDWMK